MIARVALLSICQMMVGTAAIDLVAYGCDTYNGAPLQGAPYFYSAPRIEAYFKTTACPFAGPDEDALGPCFASPASVKAALDGIPEGRRAISLEGRSLYDVQDAAGNDVFRDLLPDGSSSPWMDEWSKVVQRRFERWFANFSAIGGHVDLILADFERGGQLYWYDYTRRANASAALVADRRWPSTRAALNAAGAAWNASFDDISDMSTWVGFQQPFADWRPYVWDIVLVDQGVARALNSSVLSPIRALFPSVRMSNFAHHYHTDASRLTGGRDGWWPWNTDSGVAAAGTGSHVGTHQSTSFYGGRPWQNYSVLLTSQHADRVRSVGGTAYNALVQEAKIARDLHAAAPNVPVHPWFAPRDFDCADDPEHPSGRCDSDLPRISRSSPAHLPPISRRPSL
jgi:hypothetical protein